MTLATPEQAKKLHEVADEIEEYASWLREAAETNHTSGLFLAISGSYDIGDSLAAISPILDDLDALPDSPEEE